MEQRPFQDSRFTQEDVERVFSKLLWGVELSEEEFLLLRDESFRKALSERLAWWPHEMKWFI